MMKGSFQLKDDESYFRTGVDLKNGTQHVFGQRGDQILTLSFDQEGRLLRDLSRPISDASSRGKVVQEISDWMDELGIAPNDIHFEKFSILDGSVKVEEMPDYLQEYVDSPGDFSNERKEHLARAVTNWQLSGSYVLYWDEEYEVGRDGEIEST